MNYVPHFMKGNIVGTFTFDVVEVLNSETDQAPQLFEDTLALSSRIFEARKANDADELSLIASEVSKLAKESGFSQASLAKLEPWAGRFQEVSVGRIVKDLME